MQPSVEPSAIPSAAPTLYNCDRAEDFLSFRPTNPNAVYFFASQIILGISADDFLVDAVTSAFRMTIASALDYNVTEPDITITCVKDVNVTVSDTRRSRRLAVESGVEVSYDVEFIPSLTVTMATASSASQSNLAESVTSGDFTAILQALGSTDGAEALLNAVAITAPAITSITLDATSAPTEDEDDDNTLIIAASVLAAVLATCLLGLVFFSKYRKHNNKKNGKAASVLPSPWPDVEIGKEYTHEIGKAESAMGEDDSEVRLSTEGSVSEAPLETKLQSDQEVDNDSRLITGISGDTQSAKISQDLYIDHLREVALAGSHSAVHEEPTMVLVTDVGANEKMTMPRHDEHGKHHEIPVANLRRKHTADSSIPRARHKYLQKRVDRLATADDFASSGEYEFAGSVGTAPPVLGSGIEEGASLVPMDELEEKIQQSHPSRMVRSSGRLYQNPSSPRRRQRQRRDAPQAGLDDESSAPGDDFTIDSMQSNLRWEPVSRPDEHFGRVGSRSPRKLRDNHSSVARHDYPDSPRKRERDRSPHRGSDYARGSPSSVGSPSRGGFDVLERGSTEWLSTDSIVPTNFFQDIDSRAANDIWTSGEQMRSSSAFSTASLPANPYASRGKLSSSGEWRTLSREGGEAGRYSSQSRVSAREYYSGHGPMAGTETRHEHAGPKNKRGAGHHDATSYAWQKASSNDRS
jgi:hypothetical protein